MGTQRKTTGNTGSGTYTKAVLEKNEVFLINPAANAFVF